jgi:hypothetical protein
MRHRWGLLLLLSFHTAAIAAGWPQWGAGPTHESSSSAIGQPLDYTLSDIVYDPLAPAEQAAGNGDLLTHFQAPIVDGADVFMTYKSGTTSGYGDWNSQIWSVKRLSWSQAQLGEIWTVASDWKPPPVDVADWEPVFHPALDGQTVYAPGLGGSLLRIRRSDGFDLGRVKPFGVTLDPDTFVAGPLTIDSDGNVYYNAVKFDAFAPADGDVVGAWLVRVTPDGNSSTVDFATLVADAPAAGDFCEASFPFYSLPWPPSADAVAPSTPCGSQRPGLNVAPAVDPDGTIYTVSRAHHSDRYGYLVAVNANLTPKWHKSMRNLFNDGCNVLLPPNGTPGGCRKGSNTGVDPATNNAGSVRVLDESSSSPTIAPDGSILYGAYTRYNYAQGHLTKWSSAGDYLGSYPFGWDQTPSIYRHDGTYSIIVKENHYGEGSYCNSGDLVCGYPRDTFAPDDPEQYLIAQVDSALNVEWKFKSTNTESCARQADGSLQCVSDHPSGFEWCINAPAVDANGTVFVNSEDGGLYAIGQGGATIGHRFLQLAIGAAYTPLALGADGLVYTQNFGHLFVVGAVPDRVFGNGFE